jgi:serine/threonine protein kinase
MVARAQILAGKYRALRALGEGGFGVVLEAEHLGHGGRVAIKVLHAELAEKPHVLARFQREARALAALRGEHVARILDVVTLPGEAPFIVMELLRGNDLGKLVASRGALPVATAVDHVLQACSAIAEAHALGLVHRDIKPSNLFLTARPDGSPCIKVLDFGIAKSTHSTSGPTSITRTQDVVGTPLYMAPEQMRSSRTVDARTDIWALGATLYELLAGTPAFGGATVSDVYAMILTDSPAPLPASVPAPLASAIARCLAKRPEDRFPDVAALHAALAPFGSGRAPRLDETGAAQAMSVPPVAFDTLPVQSYTLPLGTVARDRTRAPLFAALAVVVAGAGLFGITGASASVTPAARPATAVVESPRELSLTTTPAAPAMTSKRVAKARSRTVRVVEAPVVAVETTPAPASTVATSRFE